jgi:hypothetical protein
MAAGDVEESLTVSVQDAASSPAYSATLSVSPSLAWNGQPIRRPAPILKL